MMKKYNLNTIFFIIFIFTGSIVHSQDTDVFVIELGETNGTFGTYPLDGPYNLNTIGTNPGRVLAADMDGNGTIYGLESENNNLVVINELTGGNTIVGSLTGLAQFHIPIGLSWDPTTDTMYALSTAATGSNLYTIDLNTGALTLVGSIGFGSSIWIAIDNNGVCFLANISSDKLFTINKATGAPTEIGSLGIDINNAQEADVDPATNTLYMAAAISGNSGNNGIYTINKTTAAITEVGNNNEAQITLFVIPPPLENVNCDEAQNINLGITTTNGITNTDAGASNTCFTGATDAIWYKYTATDAGNLTITSDLTTNGAVDTRLSVYDNDCNALNCIASDDNSGNGNLSTVTVTVQSGVTYYIEWDDANSDAAFDFELTLDVFCPEIENFALTNVTFEEATFNWSLPALPVNNFILQVFNQGANPMTATPIYEDSSIASTTTSAIATGLSGTTNYDAYLTVNCGGTNGLSNGVLVNLLTNIAPPSCGETFYDTGGLNDSYANDENYSLLIENSNPNDVISIDFTSVDIEEDFDFLRIYDGNNTSAPELTSSNGVLLPTVITSNIAGGNLFVTFTSDEFTVGNGWEATVNCATLNVTTFNLDAINIYPNPASNTINISSKINIDQLEIFNIMGQKVLYTNPNALEFNIAIKDLANGVYYIKMKADKNSKVSKIIKQ